MHSHAANRTPRPQQVERSSQSRTKPDNLNDGIRASPICQLLNTLIQTGTVLFEIPRLGTQRPSQFESRGDRVDRKEMLGLVLQGVDQRAESDGSAADEHDRLLRDLLRGTSFEGVVGSEPSRGEDVGHEHEVLLVDALRGLHDGSVCMGDADLLVKRCHSVRMQKQGTDIDEFEMPYILSLSTIQMVTSKEGVLVASRREALLAVEALATDTS